MSIGERLKFERHRLGMSQADFGASCGVSRTASWMYEAGQRSPDADYLAAAHALGADVLYIVTGIRSGDSLPPPPRISLTIKLDPEQAFGLMSEIKSQLGDTHGA